LGERRVQLTFTPLDAADARAIRQWRYEEPYAVYNGDGGSDDLSEELDHRSPYYAVRDEHGELVGFFNFGTSAYVWESLEAGLYGDDNSIAVGLGLRPDLTGKGLGLNFVRAGLAFAGKQFAPASFRLFVLAFNERAIRVYERAGFKRVRVIAQRNIHGEREYVEMSRPA